MDYWWKENRRYLIPVAAGLGVVAVWYYFVLGGIREDALRILAARDQAEETLRGKMASGVPSEEVVDRARRDQERASKLLAELEEGMSLPVPERYAVPASKTPGEYFQSLKEETRKKIREAAAQAGVGIPENAVGFQVSADGVSDEAGAELLERLFIVEKVVMGAIRAEVKKIDSIDPCVGWRPEDGPSRRSGAYLNRLAVRVKVSGPSKAVFEWLHGVMKKGEFLAVEDFRTTKESPYEDLFAAEMEVSGLDIDTKGSLAEPKE